MTTPLAAIARDNPWLPQPAVIRDVVPEVTGVATYHLAFADAERGKTYRFKPGQFNMLYLPGIGEVPISLSADPASRDSWAHTIRLAGNTTRAIDRLEKGGTLGLRGPYGSGWPLDECEGADVILIAGGIGFAPLRPVVYHLLANRNRFGQLTLLLGARSPDMLLYESEFPSWCDRGLSIRTTVDRSAPGWQGNVGVVSLLLERLRSMRPADSVLLLCGPEVMMRHTALVALDRGLQEEQIWVSLERNMQCAVGLCGHCQLGPAFVCKDGPIFRYDQAAPLLKIEAY